MNKREGILFLFTIAKEIEQSFQSAVIYLTEIDYGEVIMRSMVDIRKALQENAKPKRIVEIVNAFHYEWLQAVEDIEDFKKRIKDIPREVILKSIEYTTKCLDKRYQCLCEYMEQMQPAMTNEENQLMKANLDIIAEIREINCSVLLEKEKNIHIQADQTEYLNQIQDESEELLNWLDKFHHNLALQFTKVLNLRVPVLPSDLTKTLKQIVDEVSGDPDPEAQRIASLIHSKSKMLGHAARVNILHEEEIAKIVEKLKVLKDRINRLQVQNSSALMALQHKTIYLEGRLQSLENIRMTMIRLKNQNFCGGNSPDDCIFNHILPRYDRCRLVEQLVNLWDSAIAEHDHESIISILSVADLKEIFSDTQGYFSVDKYGRKIYSKNDDTVQYQLNENNELVALKDDDRRVYFYDECGRYYHNTSGQRIYKDHEGASEYLLNKTGVLVKVTEIKDGVEYFYDYLGRYHVGSDGKQIYCDENAASVYENDGLGNLVNIKIKKYDIPTYTKEPLTTEENKYLQQVIGPALKKCVANVILHQPNDPIAYLADSLVKYKENMDEQQIRLDNERERLDERALFSTIKENSPNSIMSNYFKNEKMFYEMQGEDF